MTTAEQPDPAAVIRQFGLTALVAARNLRKIALSVGTAFQAVRETLNDPEVRAALRAQHEHEQRMTADRRFIQAVAATELAKGRSEVTRMFDDLYVELGLARGDEVVKR